MMMCCQEQGDHEPVDIHKGPEIWVTLAELNFALDRNNRSDEPCFFGTTVCTGVTAAIC